ncbi:MAG TPA: TonB-dependent receptor, partial [Terriglobales bacterium]|nr:TonB-dependent receptor [Terriglobales bacterium]
GGRAAYQQGWSLWTLPVESEIAIETRRDHIDVAVHRQVQRRRFFTVTDAAVEEQSLGTYTRHQLVGWRDRLRFEVGLRGDVFFFDSRDRLRAQASDPDFQAVANHGNRVESIVSPKANLVLTPLADTDVYFNFGTGFHSNDARSAVRQGDGLVRAIGYEAGARTRQLERLDLAAALWLLDLESELTFCGDCGDIEGELDGAGNFVPGPKSRRWGVDFEARYRILDWLHADFDLSFTQAKFRQGGGEVPLAPRLLINGGLTAELGNGFSAALRARSVGDRPANEDDTLTAQGYSVFDLLAQYRWRNLEAHLGLFNFTDANWREAQFGDTSCTRDELGADPRCSAEGGGDGIEDIHFTPGNPIGARGGVTVYF